MLRQIVWLLLTLGLTTVPAGAETGNPVDTDVQIITPPTPTYPMLANWLGVSAYCEVRFAVNEHGDPIWIRSSCTHPAFCASASTAVSEARFRPAYSDGKPRLRTDIVYPLEYVRENAPAPKRDELIECEGGLTS